jgi:hypothetical protein
MVRLGAMSTPGRSTFLVVDDYGMGGIWFILVASNEEEIHEALPAVHV